MDLNQQRLEIEQFLLDVRQHIRASLETSEYENTSNMFHVTEAQSSLQLLQKCEQLLEKFTDKNHNNASKISNGSLVNGNADDRRHMNQRSIITETIANHDIMTLTNGNDVGAINGEHEDTSYLDMTATKKKISASKEYMAFNNSADSDKTFRCSTRNAEKQTSDNDESIDRARGSNNNLDDLDFESNDITFDEEPQIYDICHVTQTESEETEKAITPDLNLGQVLDCPYTDLPAGHLSIQRSTKFGQLQRIEKRFFFDQNKKCFCGILNDWLLCYADGPTASRPNITLHLKSHGNEIEHWGEGKRRDVCFQIITADPNKKFVFQANNEVDAKEWIHAIEAAIRGDCASILKNPRKLPTPPVMKRMTFLSQGGQGELSSQTDCIYEEPSPLYHVHEPTELLISKSFSCKDSKEAQPPDLPDKHNNPQALAKKYEYDVPKCPPQPLKLTEAQSEPEMTILLNNIEVTKTSTAQNILATISTPPKMRPSSLVSEISDFQSKVKDVHSKLSSQLSSGPSLQKKTVKKTISSSSAETEMLNFSSSTPTTPSTKELKKQKKSNTPSPSQQKVATIGKPNGNSSSASGEKSAKNWFLNRLNKTTSSTRSSNCSIPTPTKGKQSEKENLLSNLEVGDSYEGTDSNPASPILKSSGNSSLSGAKSKVNMIINQFESSGHLAMFSVEALAGNAVATFNSFCDNDCNNYEPIMTISTPPSSFMKKV